MAGIHDFSVALYVHEGGGLLEMGGRHAVTAGSLVRIPGWMVHRLTLRPATRLSVVNFDGRDYPESWLRAFEQQRVAAAVTLHPGLDSWFERYQGEPHELLARLARIPPRVELESVWLVRVMAVIHELAAGGGGPAEVAERLGYALTYLTSRLSRQTGRTLGQWLIDCRLERAEHLLREQKTVAEVADLCGSRDLSHFRRAFKKRTGHSPQISQRTLHDESI